MKSFKEFLVEYITNPLIWFRDYINMDDAEKAYDARHMFYSIDSIEEFLDEKEAEDEDFQRPEGDIEDPSHLGDELEKEYGEWLMSDGGDRLADEYGHSEMPSWYFFSSARIIKNTWLIHVTRNLRDILYEGFKYGIEDFQRLGLTTYTSMQHKKQKHNSDFYSFSFTPSAFRYWDREKYGTEFVMFVSSGVEAYHNGDEEYQTLFIAREARHFVPVFNQGGDFVVVDKDDDEKIYFSSEKPQKVVEWVMNHFTQYRSRIVHREKN